MTGKPVDTEKWPHVFVGATTGAGLRQGSPCRITGRKGDLRVLTTVDGKRWIVPLGEVKKAREL